jgi:hypothetical protein
LNAKQVDKNSTNSYITLISAGVGIPAATDGDSNKNGISLLDCYQQLLEIFRKITRVIQLNFR